MSNSAVLGITHHGGRVVNRARPLASRAVLLLVLETTIELYRAVLRSNVTESEHMPTGAKFATKTYSATRKLPSSRLILHLPCRSHRLTKVVKGEAFLAKFRT